ncbi:MAG: FkbM family methyltransferase [Sphingobacteriales bacterium]|nr:MAG: FkbM family methyltransferase [Sphingobacteriales bacterium]
MIGNLFYLNKLRKYLGLTDALKAFNALRINKTGEIKLGFLQHPFRMRVGSNADSSTFNEVLLRKEYDLNFPFAPERIIDGGANIGMTSIFLANKYPDATIVSVEPDAGNFALLKQNTSGYRNIVPLNTAIWHRKSRLEIVDLGRGENSFMVRETESQSKSTFQAISIDDIMYDQNWNYIDILKLDIEGSELEVFSYRYEQWIPKTKVLIVEMHDRFKKGCSKAVFSAMSKYDFSCKIKGANLVFINDKLIELVRKPVANRVTDLEQ